MTTHTHPDEHRGHDDHTAASSGGGWLRSRAGLAFLGFLAIGGFFLVTEHTAHVFGALPYLFLLACPFLHLLHGGHGGHDGDTDRPGGPRS